MTIYKTAKGEAVALLEEVLNCGFMTDEDAWKAWVRDWRPRALETVAALKNDSTLIGVPLGRFVEAGHE